MKILGTTFNLVMAGLTALLLALAVGVGVTHSYFEAQAFNKHTGKQVTTWDAIFLNMRLEDCRDDSE
jgi:hypothetical protein